MVQFTNYNLTTVRANLGSVSRESQILNAARLMSPLGGRPINPMGAAHTEPGTSKWTMIRPAYIDVAVTGSF